MAILAADHTGAWLTASATVIAAITIAIIAAITAERRLTRQLEAEASRLGQQLDHDRRQTELADLRRTIERVLATIAEVAIVMGEVSSRQAAGETDIDTRWVERSHQASKETSDAVIGVRVRLAASDPLLSALGRTSGAIAAMQAALKAKDADAFQRGAKDLGVATEAAYAAAQQRVASAVE